MSTAAAESHLRENPFDLARAQLRRVGEIFAIDPNLIRVLSQCKKAVEVSIPVSKDDGSIASYSWSFGDGGSMGPTTSRGGPYPSGDVVHAYVQPVSTHARATARYSGDYSLDGGDTWGDVGLMVPVQGPDSPVQVLEGRARLQAEAP